MTHSERSEAVENEGADRPRSRRLLIVLVAILAIALAGYAYSLWDTRAMKSELSDEVAAHVEESEQYLEAFSGGGVDDGDGEEAVQVASNLTTTRDFLLFGAGSGKISVFTRRTTPGGEVRYEGIEYYYRLQDEDWVLTDSGHCDGPECVLEAKQAFGD